MTEYDEWCEEQAEELTNRTGWAWSPEAVRRVLSESWDDIPADEDPRVELAAAHGGLTNREIGELFGLSRERIRQIEEVALRKLRGRTPIAWCRQLEEAIVEEPYDGPIPLEMQVSVEQCDSKALNDAASNFLAKHDPEIGQRNAARTRRFPKESKKC